MQLMNLSIRQTAKNLCTLAYATENPKARERLTASLWESALYVAPFGPRRLLNRVVMGNHEMRVRAIEERIFTSFNVIVHDLTTSKDPHRLWEWTQYMKPVLRDRVYPRLNQFDTALNLKGSAPIYERVKRWQRLEDLKRSISVSFPEKEMRKLLHKETLSRVEEGRLTRWIERVNQATWDHPWWFRLWRWLWSWLNVAERKVENGFLHKALETFSQTVEGEEDLSLLEWELEKRGLKAFDWKDPQMVKKRHQWLERKCIVHQSKELKLGEQIYPKKPWDEDRRVVYTLPDHPEKVVCIYWNRSLPLLERHRRASDKYISEYPPDVQWDKELSSPEWGYLVMDHVKLTLDRYEWGDEKTEAHMHMISVLGKFLKDMLDHNYTASLSATDLGWLIADQKDLVPGEGLYSVKPVRWESFDFFKWIGLLKEFAKGKAWVEQAIAGEMGLKNTPEYKFFRAVLEHVLEGKEDTSIQILQRYFLNDDTILRTKILKSRGNAFRRLVEREMETIMNKARDECEVKDDEVDFLRKSLAIVIKQVYDKSLATGFLPAGFADQVMLEMHRKSIFPMRALVLEEKTERIKQDANYMCSDEPFHREGITNETVIAHIRYSTN